MYLGEAKKTAMQPVDSYGFTREITYELITIYNMYILVYIYTYVVDNIDIDVYIYTVYNIYIFVYIDLHILQFWVNYVFRSTPLAVLDVPQDHP